jgi:hypothetical protein
MKIENKKENRKGERLTWLTTVDLSSPDSAQPTNELSPDHRTVSTKKKKSLVFFPGVDSAEEKPTTSPWKDRDDLDAAGHLRITLHTSRV